MRTLLLRPCLFKPRHQFVNCQLELSNFTLIIVDMACNFGSALDRLLQVFLLPFTQFVGMLDGLFNSGDLGARSVITALHFVELISAVTLTNPGIFNFCLSTSLPGNQRLERGFLFTQAVRRILCPGIKVTKSQRKQFCRGSTLFVFVLAVALRRFGLPIEVLYLLLNLVQDVRQTFQVIFGVPDTIGCLAATFLIFRDAGSFLDERPHFLGLGFDNSRNHALLDDRVAARAQARAQKHTRYVFAPTASAVQVIIRNPVTGNLATNGYLGIFGVLPFDRRFRIVEKQLNRGCTHGLP